jgi:hypothetical protein
MVLKMLPGNMKMPCGQSTHNILNKFEILISILYMHRGQCQNKGEGM